MMFHEFATMKLNERFFFLLGNFVSAKYNLSSAYMPSFQKKEVGSVGQRIQLAPLVGQHTSRFFDSAHSDCSSSLSSAEITALTTTPL